MLVYRLLYPILATIVAGCKVDTPMPDHQLIEESHSISLCYYIYTMETDRLSNENTFRDFYRELAIYAMNNGLSWPRYSESSIYSEEHCEEKPSFIKFEGELFHISYYNREAFSKKTTFYDDIEFGNWNETEG